MAKNTLARPLAPVAEERPDAPMRRQWSVRSVPSLYLEDIEAIVEILRHHAATSDVERLERRLAEAAEHAWAPVKLEAVGVAVDDAFALRSLASDGFSELRMRTFGHSVTLALGPAGHLLTVDDRSGPALRSLSEIESVIRRRRSRAVGFLVSDWGVPSFVLVLPVVTSTLETTLHEPGLAWLGLCLASAELVWWLWWTHERWARRRTVVIPRYRADAASLSWTGRVVAAVAAVAVLAVVGLVWMG